VERLPVAAGHRPGPERVDRPGRALLLHDRSDRRVPPDLHGGHDFHPAPGARVSSSSSAGWCRGSRRRASRADVLFSRPGDR
jgi:hypothetical protein